MKLIPSVLAVLGLSLAAQQANAACIPPDAVRVTQTDLSRKVVVQGKVYGVLVQRRFQLAESPDSTAVLSVLGGTQCIQLVRQFIAPGNSYISLDGLVRVRWQNGWIEGVTLGDPQKPVSAF